jgi:hypothetical protein
MMEGMPPSVPQHLRDGSWMRRDGDMAQEDGSEDEEQMEQIITRGLHVRDDIIPSTAESKRRNAMDINREMAEFQWVPMTVEENKSMPPTVHNCGSTKQESALGTTVMARGKKHVEGWAGTARERIEALGRRL